MTKPAPWPVLNSGFGPPGLAAALLLLVILAARCAGPEQRPEPEPAPPAEKGAVRILLAKYRNARGIDVTGPAKIRVRAGEAERILDAPVEIAVLPNPGLAVNGEATGSGNVELSPAAEGTLVLGGRRYRGVLSVGLNPEGRLTVVNHVSLPHYLRGVVGGEMPSHWHLEALKAQTVAARTYVVSRMLSRKGEAFHVYDDTRSQVYVGIPEAGGDAIGRAVDETAGQVLTHGNRILTAYFHSTCGGHTESATAAFDEAPRAPLAGVACDGCKESRYYRWSAKLTPAQIGEALGLKGVRALAVAASTGTGRVRTLSAVHEGGTATVAATRFRMKVGPSRVRSTWFTVKREGAAFRIAGRGWGHGVGLCQWGARGRAEAGASYRRILEHYYPESLLTPMAELGVGP